MRPQPGSEQRASRASAAAAATLLQQRRTYEPACIFGVCTQEVALSLHMASQLGTLANTFDNLQVLILKGAGLTSLADMQGASALVYLDLSNIAA